jgi:hypothetical protein
LPSDDKPNGSANSRTDFGSNFGAYCCAFNDANVRTNYTCADGNAYDFAHAHAD